MSGPLTDDSVVALHPLHIGAVEDGAAEVGRTDTGVFVALPPEGVELVRLLGAGLPVGEVRRRFAERFGEPPDVADFLAALQECGFVRAAPAEAAPGPAAGAGAPGVPLLSGLRPERLRWLLSRPMAVVYAAVWLAVPALLVAWPVLLPRPSDALLYHRVLPNALLVAVIASTLVMLHEFAHALAARARGCTGRFSVGRRLVFLVGQTDISDVRTLPRRERYAPYLAGMTWDLVVVLVCFGCERAGWGGQLPRTVAYTIALTFVYQFSVFMRTDVYYVIVNRLRLGNLMGDTQRYVSDLARRAVRRAPLHDLSGVPERELRVVRWYSVYYLLGSTTVLGGFLLLSVPAVVDMVRLALDGMSAGPGAAGFWDGAGFLVLVVLQFGALGHVVLRDRARGGRAGTAGAPVVPAAPN
ncbi:PqqD family protein [Streptomyces sp. NPDC001941]|uniref:PqqD family protein n=1 Tax=Streptomyces sp. NPDC001941 TaxID=3154659 RepID=UPI00332D435C